MLKEILVFLAYCVPVVVIASGVFAYACIFAEVVKELQNWELDLEERRKRLDERRKALDEKNNKSRR